MLERTLSTEILTLRLSHGKASALDLELCNALREALAEARNDQAVRAIILTGSGSIFSAGVDLPRLLDAGPDYAAHFLPALDAVIRTLFEMPKPVVAAVNGHAIAGGAIMAFACDWRLMSGGRIGVPELLVGVPFPPIAFEVVRFAIPQQHLQTMVYAGRTVEVAEAKSIGIIDEVVTTDALVARANEIAAQLAAIPAESFRLTKQMMRAPFRNVREDIAVAEVWSDPQIHEGIRAYLAKTIRK
jgi:enoyl-CoA hydratase